MHQLDRAAWQFPVRKLRWLSRARRTDGNGLLSVEEFTAGVKALPGVNASDDAIRALISAIDIDESGAIDSQEFVAMVLRET